MRGGARMMANPSVDFVDAVDVYRRLAGFHHRA